jgi:hypothetical protein
MMSTRPNVLYPGVPIGYFPENRAAVDPIPPAAYVEMLFAAVIASEYAPNVEAPPSRAARIFARKLAPRSMTILDPRAEVLPSSLRVI